MGKNRRFVLQITVIAGLTCATSLVAGASQLFTVETPSGSGTGICFDPSTGCSLAGLLGSDTALNSGGRYTNSIEFGQTGELPPGANIFAHITAGLTPETVILMYSVDGLHGGNAWSQEFSALLKPGDKGELQTYLGSTLGAKTTLLSTQDLITNSRATSSGMFDFGPGSYALTAVLTLNLKPGQAAPDYSDMLEDPSGFYYGTLTVRTEAAEPTTFLLLFTGILGALGVKHLLGSQGDRGVYVGSAASRQPDRNQRYEGEDGRHGDEDRQIPWLYAE